MLGTGYWVLGTGYRVEDLSAGIVAEIPFLAGTLGAPWLFNRQSTIINRQSMLGERDV